MHAKEAYDAGKEAYQCAAAGEETYECMQERRVNALGYQIFSQPL